MDYEKMFGEMDAMMAAVRDTELMKTNNRRADASLLNQSKQFFVNVENESRDIDVQLEEMHEQSQKFDLKCEEREETILYKEAEHQLRMEALEMTRDLTQLIKNP